MELRSSRSTPSIPTPIIHDSTMATEVTSIASAISRLIIPTPTIIDSSSTFTMYFKPAFQIMLNSLSPGADHIYLYLFFPPAAWTDADKAINLRKCVVPAPGTYPVVGTDAMAYANEVDRFKRNATKHQDSLCAMHIITQYLIKAIPDHKVRLIFPRDLCYALNNTPQQIYDAIKTHFATPTLLEQQTLSTQLTTQFAYIDATSLDKYLAAYCTTVLTLDLIGAPVSQAVQVTTLINNFRSCADSDVFTFLINSYQVTHTSIASITLASFITDIQTAASLLIERHTSAQASAQVTPFAINAVVATPTAAATKNRRHYCWSHGSPMKNNHTSATCPNPNPGHQKQCTYANRESFPGYYIHRKKTDT